MPPLALTRAQSRDVDRIAIEELGIHGLVLMENAGRGCVDVLERLGIAGPVVILCGKGNNAGDGFVIARHLAIRGHECRVLLFSDPQELRGDAAANFAILRHVNVPIIRVSDANRAAHVGESLRDSQIRVSESRGHVALDEHAAGAAWLVDALLGTGAQGDPRPPYDAVIDWINARPATTKTLAVDVPSGLDCDTGNPSSHTVRADHTCTFAAMKIGFTQPVAQPFVGAVHVCDIGAPPALIDEVLSPRLH